MTYSPTSKQILIDILNDIQSQGLFKQERFIQSPQGADILVEYPEGSEPREVINVCSNNYLGLSSHPEVLQAAHEALDERGFGMSSVRFICGTQDLHRKLEEKTSEFLGTEDTVLFSSCMDANAGVFESFLSKEDILISDRLVHASIIDGIRLCAADHDTFKHSNMDHLEKKLQLHNNRRMKVVINDGVYSMDGDCAKLDEMAELCEQYDALLFSDESHATGHIGPTGRGVHEKLGVMNKLDIITTTYGKALGGASGGCVSGRSEIVEMCRQRARPYLFSNAMAPPILAGSLKALEIVSRDQSLVKKSQWNSQYWRKGLTDLGFDLKEGDTPIIPIMLYNAKLAQEFSKALYEEGVYAIGFFFPVVPHGQARIRTQMSAGLDKEHLDRALDVFEQVGSKLGILGKEKKELLTMYN